MTCSQPGTPAGKVMAASSAGHSVPVLRHLVFRSYVIQSFGPTSFSLPILRHSVFRYYVMNLSVLRHLVFRSYIIQSFGPTPF